MHSWKKISDTDIQTNITSMWMLLDEMFLIYWDIIFNYDVAAAES